MQHRSSKINEPLLHVSEFFDGQCHQQVQGVSSLPAHSEMELLDATEVQQHLRNWALIGSTLRRELPAKIDLNFADKVMARINAEDAANAEDTTNVADTAAKPLTQDMKGWVPPYALKDANKEPAVQQAVSAWSNASSNIASSNLASTPSASAHSTSANEELPSFLQSKESFAQARTMAADTEAQPLDQARLNTKEELAQVQAQAAASRARSFFTFKRFGMLVSQVGVAAAVAVVAIVGVQTYFASDLNVDELSANANTTVGPVSGLSLASYQNSDSDLLISPNALPEPKLNEQPSNISKADRERQQKEELDRINLYVRGYLLENSTNE